MMRILELTVENIRGIKKLHIVPNGNNLVVFGQNGTGKSAVVDAIDFLLTGDISRLRGKGCGYLKLSEHGCHVDSRDDLKHAVVKAKLLLANKEIFIERSMAHPTSFKVSPQSEKQFITPYLKIAALGQHLLSRREILRYITAEAGVRAKEIQSLLNLSNIEAIRSTLVAINNSSDLQLKNADSNLNIAKSEINNLLSLAVFSDESALEKINALRKLLNGTPVPKMVSSDFKKGIVSYLFGSRGDTLTMDQIENTANELKQLVQGGIPIEVSAKKKNVKNEDYILQKKDDLIRLLDFIKKETKLKEYSLYKRLFDVGINLINDSNVCPLCGRMWGEGDFREFLKGKRQENEIANEKVSAVGEISNCIRPHIDLIRNNVNILTKAYQKFELKDFDVNEFKRYSLLCDSWSKAMLEPLATYDTDKWPTLDIRGIFRSKYISKLLCAIDKILQDIGKEYSKQQAAWDTLTKMEDAWTRYMNVLRERTISEIRHRRAKTLLKNFQQARDSVLDSIYDNIKDDFDRYYKATHVEDEKGFSSKIKHKEAELIVEVDFHTRGMFPPHALHSEGHQDSMGLCLFFALNKYLASDIIDIIVLDDVVMSIDRNHRRAVCSLLKKFFSAKQLIITTHETAWARQLRNEGITDKANMFHFVNWNIETGPTLEMEKDLWDRINEDLGKDEVPSAAQKLRRNAECFFENMCDLLGAQIIYRGHHRWNLGDYADSVISTYKKYLARAISNAKRIGDSIRQRDLEDLDRESNEIIKRTNIERWAVNESVHYNKWIALGKNDFLPVVNAFKDLFNLFFCECGSTISLIENVSKEKRKIVSCKCGKIFWNVE
jgi:DNA repair exonuclease SbcCD ATPase subunit